MLLRQVELALLLKTSACAALAEGLVLGPFLGELLGVATEWAWAEWAGPERGRKRGVV